MSELQRAWARSKVGLPAEATNTTILDETPEEQVEEDDDDELPELPEHPDDDSSSASSMSSTGTVIPSPNQKLFARPQGTYEQIPWTTYFERELYLQPADKPEVTYHAYLTSPGDKGPLFVMHHGGGSSGLSFAVVGSEIRKGLPSAGVLSLDCRGHGSTMSPEGAGRGGGGGGGGGTGQDQDQQLDLRLETLSADLFSVIELTRERMGWPQLPPIILVGHSLGGAVVVDLARSGRLGASLLGYAVLDIVEGSAMDALQSMHTYLSTRPAGFASLQSGIEWHLRTRTLRNSASARTSVPGLLVHRDGDEAVADADVGADASGVSGRPWRWRTNLAATQPFWENWFVGLSKKFLEARGGKLLLLAGTDRLDTELTIGQMQGHFIQEDLPERTAVSLVDFYRRNDRSTLVLPPKVSDMLAQGKRV
ncbi:hypothetical protein GMORB2_5634 [Geosmithia morbida]|uniref:Protein phosphatase methylesterase 1 n=1 Tax=Geosmithia morbida TaxID=1094350 RepID=A0A9P5D1H8_9HYPO|nr:uncharacterized protein GMORB2_5634 [Geosmithia morbida]KAF4123918.1 hypothetical protein GMORB2_5634 [Geosmithia morbida]